MTGASETRNDAATRQAIEKILRALEGGTGVTLSAAELQALAGSGLIDRWMNAFMAAIAPLR